MAMLVITKGYIPLNPIKPPFSYVWFSYGLGSFPFFLGLPLYHSPCMFRPAPARLAKQPAAARAARVCVPPEAIGQLGRYPGDIPGLVNVNKKRWKIIMLFMGKSTIHGDFPIFP